MCLQLIFLPLIRTLDKANKLYRSTGVCSNDDINRERKIFTNMLTHNRIITPSLNANNREKNEFVL